jgi:hypothetical protein
LRHYRGGNVSGFVGTGIGLFLVATVLRLHAGAITVDSEEGVGTRFIATLPDVIPTVISGGRVGLDARDLPSDQARFAGPLRHTL